MPEEVTAQAEETQQSALSEVEQTETAEDQDTSTQDSDKSEQPKHKGGFQKRIDRLTKRNYELEGKLERQSEQMQQLLDRLAGNAKPAEKKEEAEPAKKPVFTTDGFATYEDAVADFTEKLTDWKADQKINAALEKERKASETKTEEQRQKQVFDGYAKRLSEARSRYDDFDEVINQDVPIPEAASLAIVELDNGPDVAYHLGKHPEICKSLMSMSPFKAVTEIGKIAASLAKAKPVESDEDSDEGEDTVPPPKKEVSSAPPPMKPVTKPAPTARVDLNDPKVPIDVWLKKRREQLNRS